MRKVTNINENWYFTKVDDINNVNVSDLSWCEPINLPHTWNNLDGQDGGNDYYRAGCWYYKKLNVKKTDKEVYLEIKAASMIADVYLNGKHLFNHKGGFSTFRVRLTPHLEEENLLAVRVDNGKDNNVYPLRADFTFFGGLYRDVNLIEVDSTHFDLEYFGSKGVKVTPTVVKKEAHVRVETFVTNPKENQKLVYEIFSKEGERIVHEIKTVDENDITLTFKNPHLWHGIEDPYLYTLRVGIVDKDVILDQLDIPFGVRTFHIDKDEGFFLNGKPYMLRGVCRHQDRLNMGWAITKKEHKEDMELINEVGANTIRLAHYQHDDYFYDLCDQYGMVVWAEIPFISKMYKAREAQENALSQLKELIIQNYNHPSIICWGVGNEITLKGTEDGQIEAFKELNELAKKLDQTRYTTLANMSYIDPNSEFNKITDIVSYNHYMGWYYDEVESSGPRLDQDRKNNPDLIFGVSEYGAEGNIYYHTDKPKQSDYSEEYQTFFHEHMAKVLMERKYLWATHIWNMFDFASDARDEGGVQGRNNKGLVTYDRKIKKDSFFIYKAYWSKEPFVHICERRFEKRHKPTMNVKIFSNQKKVSLNVNGKDYGTIKGDKTFIFKDIPLEMGENKVIATSGDLKDEVIFIRQEQPELSYINQDTRRKEDLVTKWWQD
jgi:beta-galactosidase